jgi:NDP-sugar pyrophosphorylase family protein
MPGYKADIIKQYFLSRQPRTSAGCVGFDGAVQVLGECQQDWRVTLVDTGLWRNIGERLFSARKYLAGDEVFLANYSDGLADANLNELIEIFKKSNKAAALLAVRPSFSLHMVDFDQSSSVLGLRPTQNANMWVNGGFFIMRQKVFDYIKPGEELVEAPFQRLIEHNQLIAFKHESFWRPMDTLSRSLRRCSNRALCPGASIPRFGLPALRCKGEVGEIAGSRACRRKPEILCLAHTPMTSRSAQAPPSSRNSSRRAIGSRMGGPERHQTARRESTRVGRSLSR